MAYETEDHETLYCFPAFNSSCVKEKRSTHEYYIMYVFFSLLSAWTVFLNLLVIISISHFKKLHTPTNLLILSLALADLLVGLVVMPIEAMRLIETCWYFGDIFCTIIVVIMGLLVTSSLFSLVLIAIDRYVAVCHPLLYPRKITTTRTVIIICLCWILSMMYSSVFGIDSRNSENTEKPTVCYGKCYLITHYAVVMTDMFVGFIFPCTLIISLYLRIFYVVHQQVKVINSLMKSRKCVTEGSVRRKSESKAALTLGIIVTVYLLCYIPYYICSLTSDTETATLLNVLLWIIYMNSCLNPLIYALFYHWFRKSIKIILTLNIFQPESSQINFTQSLS